MSAMPTEVTTEALTEALTAFCEKLGISAKHATFPLYVTPQRIYLIVPASDDYAVEYPEAKRTQVHPQGTEFAEYNFFVEIEVV